MRPLVPGARAHATIVLASLALVTIIGATFGYQAAYNASKMNHLKTYQQQYPDLNNIAKTLQTTFTTNPTLACTDARLQHPDEELVEWWLKRTREASTSWNLLFYGEAMLGKSCVVRKVLDRLSKDKARYFYYLYARGFDAFVEGLCHPAVVGPDKFKAVEIAFQKYSKYTKDHSNALIVVDFINLEDLATLETLSKTILERNYPIRFVFIATEAQTPPSILRRRVNRVRLSEGDDTLARDYLQQIVGIKNKEQIDTIVEFTGSVFKYLYVVQTAWARNCGDVEGARKAVHEHINSEIGFLLDPGLYPEVVEICKQLVANNTLDVAVVSAIMRQNYTEVKGLTKLKGDLCEKNLFVEKVGRVRFQNRATASFVADLLKKNKW